MPVTRMEEKRKDRVGEMASHERVQGLATDGVSGVGCPEAFRVGEQRTELEKGSTPGGPAEIRTKHRDEQCVEVDRPAGHQGQLPHSPRQTLQRRFPSSLPTLWGSSPATEAAPEVLLSSSSPQTLHIPMVNS